MKLQQLLLVAIFALSSVLPVGAADFTNTMLSGKPMAAGKPTTSFIAWPTTNGAPKAIVLSIHGFGLHKSAYEAFAHRLSRYSITTYALDVRGFGGWASGTDAHLDMNSTIVEIGALLSSIHRANPGVPVFLLGESMGGALALQATALYPDLIDGVISAVPGDDYYNKNKTSLTVAMHMMHPGKSFDIGKTIVSQATTDHRLQSAWQNDPAARLEASPMELIQFEQFMNKSHQMAKKIKNTPVLVLQGDKDRLAKPESTVRIYNELETRDKELVMLTNAEHLIFEEGQCDDQTVDLVSTWIMKHADRAQKAQTTLDALLHS